MRVLKKIGLDSVNVMVDGNGNANEKVASPTTWALGGQ